MNVYIGCTYEFKKYANTKPMEIYPIYPNQLKTAEDIVEQFGRGSQYGILQAQMQSGKTGVFLTVARLMIEQCHVENVAIISGNSDTNLQNYVKFSAFNFRCVYPHIRPHIFWGNDLKTAHTKLDWSKTLIIIDESHAVQHTDMKLDRFFQKISSAQYTLSVSATPFSEVSATSYGFSVDKFIVTLPAGNGYFGVTDMLEQNMFVPMDLKTYSCWHYIETALSTHLTDNTWGIIRLSTSSDIYNNINYLKEQFPQIQFYIYVSDPKQSSSLDILLNLDELRFMPTKPSVIFITGKCRMGEVIHKDNISVCIETSINPKTDTLVQSLIGRMCGYHENTSFKIYVSDRTIKSGEINRYARYMSTNNLNAMPRCGTNIIKTCPPPKTLCTNKWQSIVPIRLQITSADQTDILPQIIRTPFDINNNSAQVTQLVKRFLFDEDSSKFHIHFVRNTKSDALFARQLSQSIVTKTPKRLGFRIPNGSMYATKKNEMNIWVFLEAHSKHNIKKYDVFLDIQFEIENDEGDNNEDDSNKDAIGIPFTTGIERFRN